MDKTYSDEMKEPSTVNKKEIIGVDKSDITESDRARALELLKAPDLVAQFLKVCGTVYVGRFKELLLLKLATITRHSNRAVNIILNGPSSVGKTELAATVLKTVDRNVLKEFTRITAQFLLYLPNSLDHMILFFRETPGMKESVYALRTALTEGSLDLGTVQSDGAGGKVGVEKRKSAKGLVMISTTTNPDLDNELDTRTLVVEITHDEKLTREVYLQKASDTKSDDAAFRIWQIADGMLEKYDVVIPYMKKIAVLFPTDNERYNRDFDRVKSLIEASAFWHQFQREKSSDGRIIATMDDYRLVYSLKDLISQAMSHAPENIVSFLSTAKKLICPTREQIRSELKVSASTIKRYIRQCIADEYITTTGKGKKQVIEVFDIPSPADTLPSPDELYSSSSEPLTDPSNLLKNKDKNGSSENWPVPESVVENRTGSASPASSVKAGHNEMT